MTPGEIAATIRDAKDRERERCARLAEKKARDMSGGEGEVYIAHAIAKAIRALRN